MSGLEAVPKVLPSWESRSGSTWPAGQIRRFKKSLKFGCHGWQSRWEQTLLLLLQNLLQLQSLQCLLPILHRPCQP